MAGVGMAGGGVHGRGHAWWGCALQGKACMAGGMHDGAVQSRGHAWQAGHVQQGGMHGRGACMAGRMRYEMRYEIRSMSRRYASYWNAFLL